MHLSPLVGAGSLLDSLTALLSRVALRHGWLFKHAHLKGRALFLRYTSHISDAHA